MFQKTCFSSVVSAIAMLGVGVGLSACSGSSSSGTPATPQGDTLPPSVTTGGGGGGTTGTTGGTGGTTSSLGPTCAGGSAQYCIGLNYYVFDDSSGNPIVPQSTAVSMVEQANTIWAQCNIQFQMESFQDVNASTYGVSSASASEADMTTLFTAFSSTTDFDILSFSGTVPSGADAWTEEAGSGTPYGTIMDLSCDDYSPILAHELGHWLGLEDNSDTSNLMDLVVYSSPDTLTSDQCTTAIQTIQQYWTAMVRT